MRNVLMLSIFFLSQVIGAELDFKTRSKDVNAAADVKKVTADFEFTNHSGKNVTISKYESTCSCMAVLIKDGKLNYAPGESGLVRTEFDMGNFSGDVDKVVALWLDNDPADKPSVSLTVRVHIPVLVSIEPKTVKWELKGKAEPQTIHLKMNHTKPIKVTQVSSSSEAFALKLKTLEEGKSYDLTVTPKDINAQGLAVIRIDTDCDVERHKIQQAFAIVRAATPQERHAKE